MPGYAFAPEDVVHFNQQCPGKVDESLIVEHLLVPKGRAVSLASA